MANTTSPQKEHWNSDLQRQTSTTSQGSLQRTPPKMQPDSRTKSVSRKPLPSVPIHTSPEVRLQETPASPVNITKSHFAPARSEAASLRGSVHSSNDGTLRTPDSLSLNNSDGVTALPNLPYRPAPGQNQYSYGHNRIASQSASIRVEDEFGGQHQPDYEEEQHTSGLSYHAFDDAPKKPQPYDRSSKAGTVQSGSSASSGDNRASQQLHVPGSGSKHPAAYSIPGLGPDAARGRTLSPLSAADSSAHSSPARRARDASASHRSPSSRPTSYVDLLNNVPYNQQVAPGIAMNNHNLQSVVGNAASLLQTQKTLDMYRANIKKNTDAAVQYEFAMFMMNAAGDARPEDGLDPDVLIFDAKEILERLADRSYPFAQYYLADGYYNGLFNRGKENHDRAFNLFLAASKHGHAESSYRAALCYEFGTGTARSYPKAAQFYRTAASKNHPGAATRLGMACLRGDMGLGKDRHREGLTWLKRAQEAADMQYNAAPYELGLIHLTGFGEDIFKDEHYAAELFTQSAELGHSQSNFLMGQAYEKGQFGCPRDAALSVHFYNGAATRGHPDAMMALCAWYLVGAPPVLEKDEAEAFQWAMKAAEIGLPKAEYAVGYFLEMGIGCRRDPLEANVWYVSAAEKGSETAKQRLAIIRAAASGDPGIPMSKAEARASDLKGGVGNDKKKFMGIF